MFRKWTGVCVWWLNFLLNFFFYYYFASELGRPAEYVLEKVAAQIMRVVRVAASDSIGK